MTASGRLVVPAHAPADSPGGAQPTNTMASALPARLAAFRHFQFRKVAAATLAGILASCGD